MVSRESIYSGVFEVLQLALEDQSFVTVSRRARAMADVQVDDMPAAFMRQVHEATLGTLHEPGPPNAWELMVDIEIFTASDPITSDTGMPTLNNAVDSIVNKFPGAATGKAQTLGLQGVQNVRVRGKIEYGEGTVTGSCVAVIPLRVVVV